MALQHQKSNTPNNQTRGGYLHSSTSRPRDVQVPPLAGQHQQKPPRIDPLGVLQVTLTPLHPLALARSSNQYLGTHEIHGPLIYLQQIELRPKGTLARPTHSAFGRGVGE